MQYVSFLCLLEPIMSANLTLDIKATMLDFTLIVTLDWIITEFYPNINMWNLQWLRGCDYSFQT